MTHTCLSSCHTGENTQQIHGSFMPRNRENERKTTTIQRVLLVPESKQK